MTYFNKQWTEEVVLPDGAMASCLQDVEAYLKANKLAFRGDYSDAYLKNIRLGNERTERTELFAEFIRNYKRSIWNERKRNQTSLRRGV